MLLCGPLCTQLTVELFFPFCTVKLDWRHQVQSVGMKMRRTSVFYRYHHPRLSAPPPSLSQEKLSRIEPKVKFLVWPFFEPKCYARAVLTLVRINIYHYEEHEDGEKWAIKCSFTWVISYLSTEICYDHSLRSVISFIPYDVLLFISCAIGKTKVSSHGCFAQQGKMRSQTKQFAITKV